MIYPMLNLWGGGGGGELQNSHSSRRHYLHHLKKASESMSIPELRSYEIHEYVQMCTQQMCTVW